jgi:hypothetical protein
MDVCFSCSLPSEMKDLSRCPLMVCHPQHIIDFSISWTATEPIILWQILKCDTHSVYVLEFMLSLHRGGPGSRPGRHVVLMVDKAALGQVFSEYFCFPCQLLFHQFVHYHNHPGVAALPSGLNYNPPPPPHTNLKEIRLWLQNDRICGLVVRVSGYRSRGPGFDSRPYQILWQVRGLERGPLSLVRTIEELLQWKSSGFGLKKPRLTAVGIRCADHATPSTRKGWH